MANLHSMGKVRPGTTLTKTRLLRRKKLPRRAKVSPRNSTGETQRKASRQLSGPLRTFLASERDALIKVESILECSATAMESDHPLKGPYYPDVIGLAAHLIRRRVVHLDDLLLDGVLPAGDYKY